MSWMENRQFMGRWREVQEQRRLNKIYQGLRFMAEIRRAVRP